MMKKARCTQRVSLAIFLAVTLFCSSGVVFADVVETKAQIESDSSKPTEIGLLELRNSFIEESRDIRNLKKSIDDLVEILDNYDSSIRYIALGGDNSSGMKDERKGSYYEYAYPNFVQIENLRAQLEDLEITKETIETTLTYTADQMLSQYSLLKEQLNMYDQMVAKTEKTYQGIEKKLELGTISQIDAESSRIELENLKYNREKIFYQVENLKYTIMSMAGLEPEKEYIFQTPIFTEVDFSNDELGSYYDSALAVSKMVYNAKRQMQALDNEKTYVTTYERFVLESDLLDFNRRYEDGIQAQETSKIEVYQTLRTYLSEFNKAADELAVAETQIKYDENYLAKLSQMEKLGQIVDTDRMSYEIKVFQSELSKKSLENSKALLGQKIEVLINSGFILETGGNR